MNIRLLRAVQRRCKLVPQNFNMHFYLAQGGSTGSKVAPSRLSQKDSCGTVGCIAGHILSIKVTAKQFKEILLKNMIDFGEVSVEKEITVAGLARKLCELTVEEATRLFFTHHWPAKLEMEYDCAIGAKAKAQVISDRIELFIQSNGTDRV